jgi:dihydrofolate synthase
MINLRLEGISRLLAKTPLPWRAIHVAGTNGKGSICAYISAMLEQYNNTISGTTSSFSLQSNSLSKESGTSKYQTLVHGHFTSPHLVDRWDCISIGQETVSFERFRRVESEVHRRNRDEKIGASEFELLTATAFQLFTEEKVDLAVVEVGMGGRLDATNIIGLHESTGKPADLSLDSYRPLPLVSAISSIGLDHQAFLGNTLKEIATEKAGIIKLGVPVVYDYENEQEVIEVVESKAAELGCDILNWNNGTAALSEFDAQCKDYLNEILSLPARTTSHIKRNATIAFIATWSALKQLHRLPAVQSSNETTSKAEIQLAESLIDVIPTTTSPGRQQRLSIQALTGRRKEILLDGAHNAQSAQALASATDQLRTSSEGRTVTWVLAASDSKDVKEIISPLLQDGDSIFTVEFGPVDGMPWVKPLSAAQLLTTASSLVNLDHRQNCGKDVLSALKAASAMAGEGSMVVAGSLYLVGDVLRLLR